MLFSGDVGRYDGPLYHDPVPPTPCDYLICESTYGDRDHPEGSILDALANVVQRAIKRGGVMLMASFAVGRAQQLIYLLQVLKRDERIPDLPIYLDSPMACDATSIYRQHREDHDLSEGELDDANPVLAGPRVHLCRSVEESKALNHVTGPAVIISSSGMMDAGRIVHHLKYRLPNATNTIVLGGFMAVGTRGRLLQDGAKSLRMHGQEIPVRAAVEKVPGLSGHADRSGLLRWLEPLPPPKQVFLVHGEPRAAEALGRHAPQPNAAGMSPFPISANRTNWCNVRRGFPAPSANRIASSWNNKTPPKPTARRSSARPATGWRNTTSTSSSATTFATCG